MLHIVALCFSVVHRLRPAVPRCASRGVPDEEASGLKQLIPTGNGEPPGQFRFLLPTILCVLGFCLDTATLEE